jgi:hypothetical protein
MLLRSRTILATLVLLSTTALTSANDDEYVRVTSDRAEKIVTPLHLADGTCATRVRDAIAQQYRDLSRLHQTRDSAIEQAKAQAGAERDAVERAVRAVRDTYAVQVANLHYAFLGRLAAELSPEQIEQVKDGMTYGVLPLTYRAYQDLVPTLTDEQKRQILAWLTEAREHAMDAGSSHEKHGWFGKYKGRINNYLAAAGIDLKQAERDLRERQKAANKD